METSQPLSIESFSYSWLVNLKPSSLENLDSSFRTSSIDASDEASSFIEMDPKSPPSRRFFKKNNSHDTKFDFPIISHPPLALVDADELFSNGYLMPLFVESSEYSNPNMPSSFSSSQELPKSLVVPNSKGHFRCPSLKRCRTLSRRMIQKYLNFLSPLFRRLRIHKSVSNDMNTVDGRETSPRISVALAYSAEDFRRSCDSESSIYEAVLHCKKSIGMHKFNMDVNQESAIFSS